MARSGSFGGSLNPYGSGSGPSFSQYSIGDNLIQLDQYKAEVAWGNGQLSDDAYLAVLQDAVSRATPGSQAQVSAQNALDDATYSIGRSRAAAQGNDALIAFDQASLARMTPDNSKYRSIKNSLNSELAQRRSDQYGKLVDQYNEGRLATAVLLTWVQSTLSGLSSDAPDYQSWQSTLASLQQRAQDEKDTQESQDYQMGRVSDSEYLAYIRARRDSYVAGSPDYATWNNRLEDATKTIQTNQQNAKDQAFFDAYNEGKKSDADYLKYIKARLDSMAPDDPNREEWQHRYNTASQSIAEDTLIYDVNHGKRPVSDLVAFYKAYQRTLNPGSAEWRSTQDKIDSIAGKSGGGSGGYNPPADTGKTISPKITLETVYQLMALPANASKELVANFNLNYDSLATAIQRGDSTWRFFDPRHPGQSVLLPVSSDALARLDHAKVNYNLSLAQAAFASGNNKSAYGFLKTALDAQDTERAHNMQTARRNAKDMVNQLSDMVAAAQGLGDDATVYNLCSQGIAAITDLINSDPSMDEATRTYLENQRQQFADNPVMPVQDPLTGQNVDRAVDTANSVRDSSGNIVQAVLNPGWHRVFVTSPTTGQQTVKLTYDDSQPGVWGQNHITVSINRGDQVVTADANVQQSQVPLPVLISTEDGHQIAFPGGNAYVATFVDGNGNRCWSYSLDGTTWLTSTSGLPPTVVLNSKVTTIKNSDGTTTLRDASGNDVGTLDADGNVTKFQPGGDAVSFYGANEASQYLTQYAANARRGAGMGDHILVNAAQMAHAGEDYAASHDLGGPGQHMTISVTGGSGGIVVFTPDWGEPRTVPLDIPASQFAGRAASSRAHAEGTDVAPKRVARAGTPEAALATAQAPVGIEKNRGRHNDLTSLDNPYNTLTLAQGVVGFVSSLLSQLPDDAGAFLTGRGLKPVPVPTLKPVLVNRNQDVKPAGTSAVTVPALKAVNPTVAAWTKGNRQTDNTIAPPPIKTPTPKVVLINNNQDVTHRTSAPTVPAPVPVPPKRTSKAV